ncbi:adenylate/guanylate cyclase domain-containing protein [Promineifilum sp.]|uniref:ATP-binding protein n=1 Tax=Promineifilum sp. TaxID=2664178 RepID=UPI0035B4751D
MDTFGRPPNAAPSGRAADTAAPFPSGGAGGGKAVVGERRVITVLFCDVVGSTSLAGRFDPEEWAEVMNEAFRYMISPVEEYGGMIARLMGDAVLAFFGAPQAHEDDPQRAVLAGLGIVNGIRAFAREFEQDYGLEFNVRVGINTGPVVVGEMGTGQAGEYTAMGDAINVAARMEQTAAPGTVQIAEDTYRLIAPLFDVWDLGGIEVKGKEEPVHAYRVLGLEPQPGRLRGLDGIQVPLVGRDREIARLRDILMELKEGQSRICYLIGEAGLGKSRLIAEVRQVWRDQLAAAFGDIDPLWRGWSEFVALSFGASRPYDMLKRQVRTYCGIRETDPPAVIHERLEALISAYPAALHERMHRVFGFLLGEVQRAGDGASHLGDGEAFQRELRSVLEQMAQVQASQGPVVYVIDDVHWADTASLEALRYLLPLVRKYPILFLFAMRPDWNTPGWQLYLEAQLEYPEYCASIYLEPLSDDHSRVLLRELLGDAEVPDAVCELIQRKAEGNPFFVEETVRTLLDSGVLRRGGASGSYPTESASSDAGSSDADGGLHWDTNADVEQVVALIGLPGNVQALLTARIDQLEPEVRRTLQLASVIGRSFPFRVLERIVEKPQAALDEHLKRLAQADLVRPAGSGFEAEYAFRHALTRDAAYETILLRQRRRYHRRVGETIEALYTDRLTDEAPRLAYHFAECRDWPRAVRYYALAGEAAARLYANVEALEHLSRALDICRVTPEAVDEAQVVELYRRRGRVLEVAGRHDDALRNYEELERLGRERHSPTLELGGLMPQAPLYLTPTPYLNAERGGVLADRILTLAERTGRVDAAAYGHWARLLLFVNAAPDGARAVEEGERALALAREHDLTELEAYVLNDIGRAYATVGRTDDAFAAFEVAYRRWLELGNEPMMADILGIWAQGLLLRGDLTGAERLAREAVAVGRRIGSPWPEAFGSAALGFALMEQGRFGEALPLVWVSAELPLQAGFFSLAENMSFVLRSLLSRLGQLAAERERLAVIRARLSQGLKSLAFPALWEALDHLDAGDAIAAYNLSAAIAWAGPAEFSRGGPLGIFHVLTALTIALAAERPVEVLAAIDQLVANLARFGFASQLGEAYRLRGDALRQLGRLDEARAAYREALDEAERQGARWAEWLALAALSELEPDPAQASGYRARAVAVINYLAGQLEEQPELRKAFLNRPEIQRVVSGQ